MKTRFLLLIALWLGVAAAHAQPLMLRCATNKTVECFSAWTFDSPKWIGACPPTEAVTLTVVSTVTNGPCPLVITRTWQVTDDCGNTAMCSQSVTNTDTRAPTITCAPDQTVECGTPWTFPPPTAFDDCTATADLIVSVVGTETNFAPCPSLFTATRIWKVTDLCGNFATCTQSVIVVDTIAPDLSCQCLHNPELVELFVTACSNAIPDLCAIVAVCATDNCGPLTCTQSPPAGTIVLPGVHPITVTVTDCGSNSATCVVDFIVIEPQSGCTCPEGTRVWNTGQGGPTGNLALAPGTTDLNFALVAIPPGGCAGPAQVIGPGGFPTPPWMPNSGESQWIGPALNVSPCQVGVFQYQLRFDLVCTNDARIMGRIAADNSAGIVLNGSPVATPPVTFSAWTPVSITSGFVAGPNVLDCYVTNLSAWTGFRAELTNIFRLTNAPDCCCPPPQITCPLPTSVPCGTPIVFTPPPAMDLCCGSNATVTALSTTTNGVWPQFVERVWLATDCRGQTATCTQTVAIVDFTPPVFCPTLAPVNLVPNPDFEFNTGCPSDFTGQITLASPWTGANLGTSDYYHSCALNPNLLVPDNYPGYQDAHSGNGYAGIHTTFTTVSSVPPSYREYIQAPLSSPLVAGRLYTVSFYVSLADRAQKAVDNLGAHLSVGPLAGGTATALSVTPQVRNPVGSFLTDKTNWTLIEGSFFADGGEDHITIGNFFTDAATPIAAVDGDSDWAYYYIDDVQVIEACCGDYTLECNGGTPVFRPPEAIDACSGTNVTVTLLTGTVVSNNPCARVHRLVWQAADACSNSITCTQLVTVVDTTPPVVTCASNKTVECGSDWTFDPPTPVGDNCCGDQITILPLLTTTSTNLCPRELTRFWRVTDCCGNSVLCSQKVTLVDTSPPALACPQNIKAAACSNSVPVYFNVKATDACDTSVQITCAPSSGSLFPLGTNTVVCTAWDDCGNSNSCGFPVVVVTGTNLYQLFPAGFKDLYHPTNDPATPGTCLMDAYAGSSVPWKGFDDPAINSRLGHTWNLPTGEYFAGVMFLLLRDRNCAGGSTDDTLRLGLAGCGPPDWIWSRTLGPSGSDPGLAPSMPWCNVPLNGAVLLFLDNLHVLPSGNLNLFPHINATSPRRLDLLIEDDTRVDYVDLWLRRCAPPNILGGLEVQLTGAHLAHGPGFWTIEGDAGATNFSASFDLGSADGVRLKFADHKPCCLLIMGTKKQPEEDETELFRLSPFSAELARFQLGEPPPGVTQVEVRILSNDVVVASNTLPATAGLELMRFPASAPILEAGALAAGNLFVVLGNGTNGTISCEARGVFPAGYVFPRMATLGLAVDGFTSLHLERLELAVAGWFPQVNATEWQYIPKRGASGDPFLSTFGDAVVRAESGQLVLSALEAGSPAPMGFTANVEGSGSNEFRALIDAGFGQFSPVPGNARLRLALAALPAGGQQEEVDTVSFDYHVSAYWTVSTARGQTPVPLRRVSVWHSNDVPVVEAQAPVSVKVSKLPSYYWPSTGWFIEADTCHRFLWPVPVTVNIDGTDYQANELRLLTGSGGQTAGTFKSLRVEATGAESLVLSQIEAGPITYRMEPPILDGLDLLLRGNTLGADFQSAPSVVGPWATVFSEGGEMRKRIITNAPPQYYRVKGR